MWWVSEGLLQRQRKKASYKIPMLLSLKLLMYWIAQNIGCLLIIITCVISYSISSNMVFCYCCMLGTYKASEDQNCKLLLSLYYYVHISVRFCLLKPFYCCKSNILSFDSVTVQSSALERWSVQCWNKSLTGSDFSCSQGFHTQHLFDF